MKNILLLSAAILTIVLSSCSHSITRNIDKSYAPTDFKQEVVVFGLSEIAPKGGESLGTIRFGDTGFSSNCGYEVAIEKAKLEARKVGGNAIKVIKHVPPSLMGSTCDRITVNVLKYTNPENLKTAVEEELLDIDHAILYVYRTAGSGFLVSYDLYLGDSVICRVKNNFKTKISVHKDGLNSLWAKTESKTEIPINIKPGKEYYLRCGIKLGAFVGRPDIQLVDKVVGKGQYASIKAKVVFNDVIVRKNGDKILCQILEEGEATVHFNMKKRGKTVKTQLEKENIEKIEYADKRN